MSVRLYDSSDFSKSEFEVKQMIERGGDDRVVKRSILPRDVLGDCPGKNERMRVRGAEWVDTRDGGEIVTVEINWHGQWAASDIQYRPLEARKTECAKLDRARIIVAADVGRWVETIRLLAIDEQRAPHRKEARVTRCQLSKAPFQCVVGDRRR